MTEGKALFTHIEEKLLDLYGPPGIRRLPDGLRLELHPVTVHFIWSDMDLWRLDGSQLQNPSQAIEDKFLLPVKVNPDLERLGWRLVIVTEELLDGGRLKA